jgi:hypothetical protein
LFSGLPAMIAVTASPKEASAPSSPQPERWSWIILSSSSANQHSSQICSISSSCPPLPGRSSSSFNGTE